MAKRALLIGCNYPGTDAALLGCVNDVFRMKSLYEECFGFTDITILVDTDDNYLKPTGKQIKESLTDIVQKTQPNDILVVHFSGHGVQVPSDDPDEADMKDEALVPTDMNLLLDDDLREIMKNLPNDSYLTFVCDCCHSGGMLDHREVQITGPKDKKSVPKIDSGSIFAAFGLRDKGVKVEGVKNRSLPTDTFLNMMGSKSGKNVDAMNVRNIIGTIFGDDASTKVTSYVDIVQRSLGSGRQGSGCLSGALGFLPFFRKQPPQEPPPEFESMKPGHKPPPGSQLNDDVGVLITGCQAHETSSDACPGGDPAAAYGALSNAIETVVRAHFKRGKGPEMSNKDLVFAVRKLLGEGYYDQNPCLECSERNADRGFISGKPLPSR